MPAPSARMIPLLLRLLLCLCLVVDTTAAAWAGGMAAPAAVPAPAPADTMAGMASSGCHDADASAPAPATAAQHPDHAPPGHAHGGACCKTSCDCLQHCAGAALPAAALALTAAPVAAPGWLPHSRRGDPAPYRPVRPPIA